MRILVFLEHHLHELKGDGLGVLSRAASLEDAEVAAVLVGSGVSQLASKAAEFGATRVLTCDQPELDPALPQPRVDVIAQAVRDGGYDTVLFANSVLAADIAAGLAARLDAGLNWDLVDLARRDGDLVGTRPALGDSVHVEVGWSSTPRIALFRAGSFEPSAGTVREPEIVNLAPMLEGHSTQAQIVEQQLEEATGRSLEDAAVVVAGGRGLGTADAFALAEGLATALGGVVGATRAAVDAGWYPLSAQIGQTGHTVSPKLYVALGISGAIQHKVGMQNSGVIVAINEDASAPIFEFSDLGVVGDLHAIVPELIELISQRQD